MNRSRRTVRAMGRASPRPPTSCCRSCTTNYDGSHHARLPSEALGQTLQATALVHEEYRRLVRPDPGGIWDGRGHFFAAAAEAMRPILIEAARPEEDEQTRRRRHAS